MTYLKKARELGDILMVGVNSDRSVRELKGEDRPINTQEDRAAVLAALEMVDQVVVFDDLRADKFLAAVQPDIWVKGGDYTLETLDAQEVEVIRKFGDVVIIPAVAGYSTTRCLHLIEKAETQAPEILEGSVPRRDEAPAPGGSGGPHASAGEDAGSILRAPESLRAERSVP